MWAGQDHDPNAPKHPGVRDFLNFRSILSGSGPQILMVPTTVSAVSAVPDHGQNVPKGVRGWVLFEFLLYLIRKWFPDAHGAHPGVGGVSRSGP